MAPFLPPIIVAACKICFFRARIKTSLFNDDGFILGYMWKYVPDRSQYSVWFNNILLLLLMGIKLVDMALPTAGVRYCFNS